MAFAEWQPERPSEFVIQTSPGGGSDTPGGAGAVAMTHLFMQAGDPHYITPTLNSLVTTPLQQEIPVMYPSEDLTPIANLVIDPFLL